MNSKQPPIQLESAPTKIGPIPQLGNFIRDRLMGTITMTIVGSLVLSGASIWNIYNSCRSPVTQQVERPANVDSNDSQGAISLQLSNSFIAAGVVLSIELLWWLLVLSAVRDYIRDRRQIRAKLQQAYTDVSTVNESLQSELQSCQQQVGTTTAAHQHLESDLSVLMAVIKKIESGDLSARARVNDRASGQIGDALNHLVAGWQTRMSRVSVNAQQIASNGDERGDLAAIVIHNATEQNQWIDRVSTLTATVRESANTATTQLQETYQSISDLQTAISEGDLEIDRVDRQIDTLQQGSDRIIQQMKTLGEFIGLADKFVYEQGDIATQTQVLALNASLVAARAAEQRDPRQFEAVAREFESIASQIGQLAQQTNESLNSLEQSNNQIHQVVSDVDGEVQRVGSSISSLTQGIEQARAVFTNVELVTERVVAAGEVVAQTSQTIVAAADSTAQSISTILALANQVESHSESARQLCDRAKDLSAEIASNIGTVAFSAPVTTGVHTVAQIPTSTSDRSAVATADYQLN